MTCELTWNRTVSGHISIMKIDKVQLRQRIYLLQQLIRRDVERRYKATVGGMAWTVLQPLVMIGIYTVVFGLIFKPRWPTVESPWDYVLILFLGKIPYMFVTESLARSSALIHGHINLVKKAVFPLNLLPGVAVGGSVYHSCIALAVWLVFFLVIKQSIPFGMLLLPLLWIPIFLFCLGGCWILAALGAYFRDTEQLVGSFNIALMFLSPIFYPAASAPGPLKLVMAVNPLSYAIESARALMLWPEHFSWEGYFIQLLLSVFFATVGLAVFNRLRPGFADAV